MTASSLIAEISLFCVATDWILGMRPEKSTYTLEYRINGGGLRIIGRLEMVPYKNNRGVGIMGGMLGEIENSHFLR